MKSWPFQEAQKIVRRIERQKNRVDTVTFSAGFGPSGNPHIGTFAEIVRTRMVARAFQELTNFERPVRLIVFSDDYDALRRVPSDVDSSSGIEEDLGLPLTEVRDPDGEYESFAARNNASLKDFISKITTEDDIPVEFLSATDIYRAGEFDTDLIRVAQHYDEIMAIMLPTLGEERRATYSPFLPRSRVGGDWGRILQVPVRIVDADKGMAEFQDVDGTLQTIYVGNGNTKLQWKVDWAMRWGSLGVDYEMCGKDLTDSYRESSKIARVLGHEPPVNLIYELFLDENGQRQSKSRGNGLSLEGWTHYGTTAALAHYMFQAPTVAKRVHVGVIARAQDEYLKNLSNFEKQTPEQQLDNPVWHIHAGNPPSGIAGDISFGLLINMARVTPGIDTVSFAQMLKQYRAIRQSDARLLSRLIPRAIAFGEWLDKDSPRVRRNPSEKEAEAFRDLISRLSGMEDNLDAEAYQFEVYEVGKAHGFDPLRAWFQALYEVLFGEEQGPRFGTFIAAIGRGKAIELLEAAL